MPLLTMGGLLIMLGLAILYSAGVYASFEASQGFGGNPSNYYWFTKQLINLLISLVVGVSVLCIPLKVVKKHVGLIAIGALVFQLLVFTPLGKDLQGARGWIVLASKFSLQPVEFYKIGWVIFLSAWLVKKKNDLRSFSGFLSFLIISGVGLVWFLFIPDLGSLLLLVAVSLALYRYQGGKGRFVLLILFVAGIVLSLAVRLLADRYVYIQERVDAFTNYSTSDKDTASYQVYNALVAVGGGGVWGRGYGNGLQKFDRIPEVYSDFIFAAFAEEGGFVGSVLLLGLYAGFIYICMRRVSYINDLFYKNMAIGLVSTVMFQMFINIAVNIKLMPVTGLTLPFVSYGGSSLMASVITLILLYKIFYLTPRAHDETQQRKQRSFATIPRIGGASQTNRL